MRWSRPKTRARDEDVEDKTHRSTYISSIAGFSSCREEDGRSRARATLVSGIDHGANIIFRPQPACYCLVDGSCSVLYDDFRSDKGSQL